MDKKEVLHIFETTDGLMQGHFQLTSGLHSPSYFQCAVVLQHPEYLRRFCTEIVDFYSEDSDIVTAVVTPAVGGIVVGQEVGRQLGVRSVFAERVDGEMKLRRGFKLTSHDNVLVVEDVITTGGSVLEVVNLVEDTGAQVLGVGCVVDRKSHKELEHLPLYSVFSSKLITYKPDECPLCQEKKPLYSPGSRQLNR